MADKHAADDQVEETSPGPSDATDDTEGHLLMPNIAAARALANSHGRELERNNKRVRVQHKDSRSGESRSR